MLAEKRSMAGAVEVRADDDKKKRISGYAAVFFKEGDPGTEYKLWEGVRERIMPGAFDSVLSAGSDTFGLFNHDPNHLLGRTKSGSLKLSVDTTGLRYEIEPADSRVYEDVLAYIERGDVDGSSFSFMVSEPGASVWMMDDATGEEIREIRKVTRLIDVGPVVMPAYEGTTAGARADGDVSSVRSERDKWRAEIENASIRRQSQLRKNDLSRLTD